MQKAREDCEKTPGLGEALLAFARHRGIQPAVIARLTRECEPFREVCADYEECCATLLNLQRKGTAVNGRVRDYVEMRDHLERDLLRCLEPTPPCRSCARRVEQGK